MPNMQILKSEGRKLQLQMEAQDRLPYVSVINDRYKNELDLCLITLGYTLFIENNPRNFTWILY